MPENVKEIEKDKQTRNDRLQDRLSIDNPEAVPEIEKVVVNVGIGDARVNVDKVDVVQDHLSRITGQKTVLTRAQKSVADFELREGDPAGVKATLRGERMHDFLYRLVHLALPMTKEFQGISESSFDHAANFSLGIEEQVVFPEITYDEADTVFGMDITIVTSTENKDQARALLEDYGFPFEDKNS